MLPLWSSYLVKVYAWKLILAKEGILTWLFGKLAPDLAARRLARAAGHRRPLAVGVSFTGTFIVFVYVWLPFMILPIAGGARARAGAT